MSGRHRHKRRGRARLSPLTVLGELLLVSGLVIVGYLVWQPWYTGTVVTGQQVDLSSETSAELSEVETEPIEPGTVPVAAKVAVDEVFAVMYIPAFGENFMNRVAEGTSRSEVLNVAEKGIGRYETTQMPGERGNFAVAAHRSGTHTTPFKEVMNLRVGDPIFVETAEGWYTYRFRSLEYVWPTETDVLLPFPRVEGTATVDEILTLTTCHPKDFGSEERVIAYSLLEGFQARADGPPEEMLEYYPNMAEA